jgi:putative SOS response-associated peptidase YedK
MCNLYSVTKGQSAIRDLFSVKHDRAGNLPPLPAILPDQMAPIVRVGPDGERESEPCHAPGRGHPESWVVWIPAFAG